MPGVFQVYCKEQSPVCWFYEAVIPSLVYPYLCLASPPVTVDIRGGLYHMHWINKTIISPVHGVFPAADVSGLHLSGYLESFVS